MKYEFTGKEMFHYVYPYDVTITKNLYPNRMPV